MNKNILSLLMIIACNIQAEENALEHIQNNYRTSFLDLSFKDQALAGLCGVGGAALYYIGTKACENALSSEKNPVEFFKPKQWNWAETVTTPLGALVALKAYADSCKPEAIATKANANGLLNLILNCASEEEMLEALDQRYVTHRFGRSMAFTELTLLRNALYSIKEIISTFNARSPKKGFNTIVTLINTNIKKVDTALRTVKRDARWFEECNAHTMNQAQQTQRDDHNARVAGSVLNLAHAYSR